MEDKSILVKFDPDELEALLSALSSLKENGQSTSMQLIDVEKKLKSAQNQKDK